MTKSTRKGEILIDHLRNGRGSTAVAPYSTRARPGAVSLPLVWAELSIAIGPAHFTVTNALPLAALDTDPWENFQRGGCTADRGKRLRRAV